MPCPGARSVAINEATRTAAIVADGAVSIITLQTGELLLRIAADKAEAVAFSRDGGCLCVVQGSAIRFIALPSGSTISEHPVPAIDHPVKLSLCPANALVDDGVFEFAASWGPGHRVVASFDRETNAGSL